MEASEVSVRDGGRKGKGAISRRRWAIECFIKVGERAEVFSACNSIVLRSPLTATVAKPPSKTVQRGEVDDITNLERENKWFHSFSFIFRDN